MFTEFYNKKIAKIRLLYDTKRRLIFEMILLYNKHANIYSKILFYFDEYGLHPMNNE